MTVGLLAGCPGGTATSPADTTAPDPGSSETTPYPDAGKTWYAATMPSVAEWISATYGNGRFVAVANAGATAGNATTQAAWSSDGKTWNDATLCTSANWTSVTYGNGKYVAVAWGTAAAYSADGVTWTAATLPTDAYWGSVRYGSGVFVAIAAYDSSYAAMGTVAVSTDGATWTSVTLPTDGQYWYALAWGNGRFVVLGYGSTMLYSTDGKSWTAGTLPTSAVWESVDFADGVFVAAAYATTGTTATTAGLSSTDGITWSDMTLPASAFWGAIAGGSGSFAAIANGDASGTPGDPVGTTAAAYSTDGVTWSSETLPAAALWGPMAYGKGTFVAIANQSASGTATNIAACSY